MAVACIQAWDRPHLLSELLLKLIQKAEHRSVFHIQHQHILGGDDALDMLQVYQNGSLSTQDGARVHLSQHGVQYSQIPCV